MKLTKQYQELARLAQAYLTSGSGVHRAALEAAVQKALGKPNPAEKAERKRADVVLRFDGGTPVNSAAKGFSCGYGSFRLNEGRVERVSFGEPMSNNAAEVAILCAGIKDVKAKHGTQIHLHIIGDSKIALLRCKKAPKTSFQGKPSSPLFLTYCDRLLNLLKDFRLVTTEWQPRAKSVALFGH